MPYRQSLYVSKTKLERTTYINGLLYLYIMEEFGYGLKIPKERVAVLIGKDGIVKKDIEEQTQLQIQKLNDRYYAVTKTKTVNICAQVLDNFEQNTVSGATVEILGTDKATVTDENGNFYLSNVPRDAYVQIKFLGFYPLRAPPPVCRRRRNHPEARGGPA